MQVINLNGAWRVMQEGNPESTPATVPGCIHLDLLAAGKIPGPFYRDNEKQLQWIGETNWIYERSFNVLEDFLRHDRVLLRCEGVDTLATLTLNGTPIAHTDNMFRTWEIDAKQNLIPGNNAIRIHFDSPIPYIQRKQAEHFLPDWHGKHEMGGRGWVRKEPYNFGWDWGPVLITCGIWRPISLLAFDTARLTGMRVAQDHSQPSRVLLQVAPEVESVASTPLTTAVTVSFNGTVVAEGRAPCSNNDSSLLLEIANPELWWPHTLGSQPLYDVHIQLHNANGETIDQVHRRIGLRTMKLERKADESGESFRFVVNGVPFFAKGSNWIPADSFANRVTPVRYRELLESAVATHQNMVRVWGGGIYEEDVFYDLCDQLGICVWQDMMFACSTYPTFDETFLSSARAEATDNIRRLRHHPCIALWCGNNELEQGLVGTAWNNKQMSWEDYGKLFDQLLPEVVRAHDPERDYWPSSAHSPRGDRALANSPGSGDAHLWDVWHGRQPFEWYRASQHRFVSEFGFQSFPEPRTVQSYTLAQDRNITSYVMELHQRSGIGNTVILQYMLDWFRLPTSFEMTLWLSQILQGIGIKIGVEHWRRNMPRTMGTLYWQLNDCWPVASWSSVDYHGRWKALHYMARRFYAPILISAIADASSGNVEIFLTNDTRQTQHGTVSWSLTRPDGTELASDHADASIDAFHSTPIKVLNLRNYLVQYGSRDLLLWLNYRQGNQTVSEDCVLFAPPKHLELPEPDIAAQVELNGENEFLIRLTSRRPALWVWIVLDGIDAHFSDNFFHLRPGEPKAIRVTTWQSANLESMRDGLRVYSLFDTYQ